MEVELDEIIKRDKKSRGPRRNYGDRDRNKDHDRDGDSNMGHGPRRQERRRERNTAPYHRPSPRFHTTGDVDNEWKHDLYDKEEDEIEPTGWGTRRKFNNREDSSVKLSVENLHYEITEEELKKIFEEKAPGATTTKILFDRTGRSTGNAEVLYNSNADAEKALSLDGTKIKDEVIRVYIKVSPPKASASRDSHRSSNSPRGSSRRGAKSGSKRDVTFNISLGSPPREKESRYNKRR